MSWLPRPGPPRGTDHALATEPRSSTGTVVMSRLLSPETPRNSDYATAAQYWRPQGQWPCPAPGPGPPAPWPRRSRVESQEGAARSWSLLSAGSLAPPGSSAPSRPPCDQ
ncbi:hypothetical protein NN561_015331 [Cricetulus griseus]